MENLTLCVPRPSSSQHPYEPVLVRTQLAPTLPNNHVLIRVERFGFSANNMTYHALGEAPYFRYFDFHAAPTAGDVSPETHAVIPVWGFGTVMQSAHPRVEVGERVYGYLAPSRFLLLPISPSGVNKFNLYIPRPHLPADRRPYNQMIRCQSDPQYDSSSLAEDLTMLYRPLFWTAFWCEDWLCAAEYRGATHFLTSSASSKTAFCLAYLLGKRRLEEPQRTFKTVALTSKRNVEFTRNLGLYNVVLDYDSFESANIFSTLASKWMYIDVAGNDHLNRRVWDNFAANKALVVLNVQLGLTNLSPSAPSTPSIKFATNTSLSSHNCTLHNDQVGPAVEQFFMPEWLAIRKLQLSVAQIAAMQAKAWRELMRDGKEWVQIEHVFGGERVQQAFKKVARRGTDPTTGAIWSLWDSSGLGRSVPSKL